MPTLSLSATVVVGHGPGTAILHRQMISKRFSRLELGNVVSENFYLRGLEETPAAAAGRGGGAGAQGGGSSGYNLAAIRTLSKIKLEAATQVTQQGGRWVLTTQLRNRSAQPALMVRVKAVREKTGDRILPAIFSDNYVALMPGEGRTIRTELESADARGERPKIVVEGFNVQ